jgi:hypothetical protein
MIVFWNVCILSRKSRQRTWQNLFLDTATLDPVAKATVEYLIDSTVHSTDRKILEFGSLFRTDDELTEERFNQAMRFDNVRLDNYVDEDQREILIGEVGQIVTGNPNVAAR